MAYHKSREEFAAGFSVAKNTEGKGNTSDILTKPVIPSEFYKYTGPVIFGRISKDYQCSPKGELHKKCEYPPVNVT